jgi:hypothetical protein
MDVDLQEKIKLIDEQIRFQFALYKELSRIETYTHCYWSTYGYERERQIYNTIDSLQEAKERLITGEKLPEIIYKDREVIKYEDRVVKHITIIKSSFTSALLWVALIGYIITGLLYISGHLIIGIK